MADVNNPIANLSIDELIKLAENPIDQYRSDSAAASEKYKPYREGLGSFSQFLDKGLALPFYAGKQISGGISDALGFGSEFFGKDKLAANFRQSADIDQADASALLNKGLTGSIIDGTSNIFSGPEAGIDNSLLNERFMDFVPTAGFEGELAQEMSTEEAMMGMPAPVGGMSNAERVQAALFGATPAFEKSGRGKAPVKEERFFTGEGKPKPGEMMDTDFLNTFEEALLDTGESKGDKVTPETKEDLLAKYKKEFYDATGLDSSGKVDKSAALMALGLSLMQNKAGKGFNVGKMLSAVGEAGEKALPALNKAKQTARQGVLAAGKYALQMESSDEAKRNIASEKAMDRGKYWVYKKGKPGAEFSSFDEGEFVDLNKYELNKLISNPEFDNQFEFISGADRLGILKTRAEGTDYGEEWDSKGHKAHSLIGGDPSKTSPLLTVLAVTRDANYKGPKGQGGFPLLLGTSEETLKNNFIRYQDNLNNGSKRFQTLLNAVNQGVSIPEQIGAGINTAIRALGFTGGEVSDITEAKRILGNIAIDEAILILKETGKTLSDNDRKRVEKRVGEIDWSSADAVQIKKQIKEIYELVILNPQKDLDLAINNLQSNFGITIAPANQPPTEAEFEQINKRRIAKGLKPRKMEEYQ